MQNGRLLRAADVTRTIEGDLERVPEVPAIALEVLGAKCLGVGGKVPDAAAFLGQGADGDGLFVGDHHDERQLPNAGRVHGFVQIAFGRRAVADDGHGQAIVDALDLEAHGITGGLAELHADRALNRQDTRLGDIDVIDHLAAAAHRIGVLGELLPHDGQGKLIFVPVELAPHRAQGVGAIVRNEAEVLGVDDFGQSQCGGCPVDFLAGAPNGELDLAAAHQSYDGFFGGPRAGSDSISQLQIVWRRLDLSDDIDLSALHAVLLV